MKNTLKQFAAWVTNFRNKPFFLARLKLTAFYTIGVLIILIVFSLAVYMMFSNSIRSDLGYEGIGREDELGIGARLVDSAEDRLQNILIIVDGAIIILVAGLSYYLAGKTLAPIEKSYLQQKKFVADAAHELRTPLAVMRIGVEAVLKGDNNKEKYKKILRDSLEEMKYLSNTVNDLLFLASGDDLKKQEFSQFNFSRLASKQIELMGAYVKSKKIIIKSEIESDLQLDGNEAHIKRLLANMLKNAVDYNKQGGEVIVSLRQVKNNIELKVRDTGIGIGENDLKQIFNRFYKVDKSRSQQAGGAGLGLSIVKDIVELHKGNIDIKSKLDSGTEITVLFNAKN